MMVLSGTERATAGRISSLPDTEGYCPLHTKWRKLPKHQRSNRTSSRVKVTAPLFPGYVFALPREPELQASAICRVKGVIGIVRTEDGMCYAPDEHIALIKDLEARGKYDAQYNAEMRAEARKLRLEDCIGKSVTITEGSMAGYRGVVLSAQPGEVKVELDSNLNEEVNRTLPSVSVRAGCFRLD